MKTICTFCAAILFTAITVLAVNASKHDALAQPQTTLVDSKFAIIDTEEFGDAKTGVARLTAAFDTLDRELKPDRDELQAMRTRYDQLVKEINDTKAVANQSALTAKTDQAETLQKEMKRKQEDGQRKLDRRAKELTDPIYADLSTALQAFAKQRGVSAVFDISKFRGAVMVVNDQVNITQAFIADYNGKHPPAAATAPADKPKP